MEDELMGMVLQLAGWVEGVAPEVWAIMMRQALVQGIKNIFGVVIALVMTICLVLAFKKFCKMYGNDEYEYSMIPEMGMTFSGIGIGISVIVFCVMLADAIGYLFNPQYYALKGIIALFK